MSEELGKNEKPPVEEFKVGRKIFFVPLVLSNPELPQEFQKIVNRYWEQVDSQIVNLELKLGLVSRIYHEMVPETGEKGLQTISKISGDSLQVVQRRLEKGAILDALEENEILYEIMDWSRCLSIGLQSQKVYSTIYGYYTEANKTRNESIAKKINDTLKENESCILIMGESHHVQFPSDVNIFYIAPPALDELKRWVRDYEAKAKEQQPQEQDKDEPDQSNTEDAAK